MIFSSTIQSRHTPAARRPRGFTLIELLVVMTIIAVLAFAVMAGATKAIRAARTTKSKATLKEIHLLMTTYIGDNNGSYPISVYQSEPDSPTWRRKIWENANGTFSEDPSKMMGEMQSSGYASVMWCPMMVNQYGQEQHPEGRGSFALNRYFMPPAWGGGKRHITRADLIGQKEPYIMAGTPYKDAQQFGTFYHLDSSNFPYDTYWSNLHYAYGGSGEMALGLFIDGRVESISKDDGVKLNDLLGNPNSLE